MNLFALLFTIKLLTIYYINIDLFSYLPFFSLQYLSKRSDIFIINIGEDKQMEKFNIKSNSGYQFFGRHRNIIHIVNIYGFLNLDESLKLSCMNSLVFKSIKKLKQCDLLVQVKKKYLAQPAKSIKCIEEIIKEIGKNYLINEKEQIVEYFAFYAFNNFFSKKIILNNNSENEIFEIMKHISKWNQLATSVDSFYFDQNNFSTDNMNLLLSQVFFLCPNLTSLTITNSQLNDKNLNVLIPYLEKNKNLKNLVLDNNSFGLKAKSAELLKFLKENKSLKYVSINNCYFDQSSIDLIREIYYSNENKIDFISFYYNLFDLESAQSLFMPSAPGSGHIKKTLAISFKYSPDYLITNNMRVVKFSENFLLNVYDQSEFYEIYLEGLDFEVLSIDKIDNRIVYVIESIFIYNNKLLGLIMNVANNGRWIIRSKILKLLKMDKLNFLDLQEFLPKEGDKDLNSIIIEFFKIIKELKNFRNLKLKSFEHLEIFKKIVKELVPDSESVLLFLNFDVEDKKEDMDNDRFTNIKNYNLFNSVDLQKRDYTKIFA